MREKHRKDALADNQSRLDPHLREKQQKEAVIPYSDERFRDAAVLCQQIRYASCLPSLAL